MAAPVTNNNQDYSGFVRYLQNKKVYSQEIDGTIDENGDGEIEQPDGKNSAAEWEYYFQQAERYKLTSVSIINYVVKDSKIETVTQYEFNSVVRTSYDLKIEDPESLDALAHICGQFLESGHNDAVQNNATIMLQLIAHNSHSKPETNAYIARLLVRLIKSKKIENPSHLVIFIINMMMRDMRVAPEVKEELVPSLFHIIKDRIPGMFNRTFHALIGGSNSWAREQGGMIDDLMGPIYLIAKDPRISDKTRSFIIEGMLSIYYAESAMPIKRAVLERIAGIFDSRIDIDGGIDVDEKIVREYFTMIKTEDARDYSEANSRFLGKVVWRAVIDPIFSKEITEYYLKILYTSNDAILLRGATSFIHSLFRRKDYPEASKKMMADGFLNAIRTSRDITVINNISSVMSAIITSRISTGMKKDIIDTFIAVLEKPDLLAFFDSEISMEAKNRLKEAAGFALVNAAKDDSLPQMQRDLIARKLLAIAKMDEYGELGRFIVSILIKVAGSVSPEITRETNSLIDRILPATPPYDSWFKRKKDLTVKIYFQEQCKFDLWRERYLNERNGFRASINNKGYTILKKEKNGTTITIIIPIPAARKEDFKAEVFESMADPDIDWIVYNGHSGMGAELAISYQRAPKAADVILKNPKLIQIASCTSAPNYLGKTKNLYPSSQFIGTTDSADSRDGCTIFAATLEGIIARKSWKEIKVDMDSRKHYKPGNYILPHQPELLSFLDSDGDGIIDKDDEIYNLGANANVVSIDTFEFRSTLAEPPAGKLNQVIMDVSVSYYWNDFLRYFKDIIRYPEQGEFRNKGWFRHREDKADFLKVHESRNGEGMVFDVEVNAGYFHCSITTLKIMMIYELNRYFAENYGVVNGKIKNKMQPTSTTLEEKLRGFLLSVEVLEKIYAVTSDPEEKRRIEELYMQFLEKYGFSRDIPFALVLDALTADNGPDATPTSMASMERLRKLII